MYKRIAKKEIDKIVTYRDGTIEIYYKDGDYKTIKGKE